MFIAKRELRVSEDGRIVVYKPGDVVKSFEKWNTHAREAHLSFEYVEEVGETPMLEPQPIAIKTKPKAKKKSIAKKSVTAERA